MTAPRRATSGHARLAIGLVLAVAGCQGIASVEEKFYVGDSAGGGAGMSGTSGQSGSAGMAGMAGAAGTAGAAGVAGATAGAGTGGDSGSSGAAGSGSVGPGKRPPPPPAGYVASSENVHSPAFAIRSFDFGDPDEPDHWRSLGFDIDGLDTTDALAQDTKYGGCFHKEPRIVGSKKYVTYEDGYSGRDNVFGQAIFSELSKATKPNSFSGLINNGIDNGSGTLLFQLQGVGDDNTDQSLVTINVYATVTETTKRKWDGSDHFKIDRRSLRDGVFDNVADVRLQFKGYMTNDTVVSGVFENDSKGVLLFGLGATLSPAYLSCQKLVFSLTLNAAHTQITSAAFSLVVAQDDAIAAFARPLQEVSSGCDSTSANLLGAFLPSFTDLAGKPPYFQDASQVCDKISFGFNATMVPVVSPDNADLANGNDADPCGLGPVQPPPNAGSAGSGGNAGSSGSSGQAGAAGSL